jgi:hypothetical protein
MMKRTQVQIEPSFAVTAHNVQGQITSRVVVDLAGMFKN